MGQHWFWWALTMACVVWYSTITIYVGIKGAADIKQMLARLAAEQTADERVNDERANDERANDERANDECANDERATEDR